DDAETNHAEKQSAARHHSESVSRPITEADEVDARDDYECGAKQEKGPCSVKNGAHRGAHIGCVRRKADSGNYKKRGDEGKGGAGPADDGDYAGSHHGSRCANRRGHVHAYNSEG